MRHSLIRKCVCAICAVAAVMLFLVEDRMDDWVYRLLRPQLHSNVSVVASAVGTKISYILHQNTQYLLRFWLDTDLMDMAVEYADQDSAQQAVLYEEICQRLSPEILGKAEPGAIRSTRNVFLVTQEDCYLGPEEQRDGAEQMMQSEWYAVLPETLEQIKERFPEDLPRCYSPVFTKEDGTEVIYYAMRWKSDEAHRVLIFMEEPFSDFRELFGDLKEAKSGDLALVGYGGLLIFTNKEQSVFEKMSAEELGSLFPEEQYAAKLDERREDTLLGVRISYQIEDLRLAVCLKKEDFLRPYQPFLQLTGELLLVFTAVLLVLIVLILRKTLSRIRQLSDQMQQVRSGDSALPERIAGNDEVGMLADSFYQMMDQLKKNMNTIREQKEREKQIEYSLLVSQINPHFIYNTLNTITYLAGMNRTKDIMVINKALIGMLRDRLQISGLQTFDTLAAEVQHLEAYMTIQQYLCSGEITYEFHCDPDCEGLLYPKNVLQPLVENSILHGILLKRDKQERLMPGRLSVTVSRQQDEMVTKITDSGVGMTQDQIRIFFEEDPQEQQAMVRERGQRGHIGIYNIRMRMNYLYGEKFRMRAFSPEEGGLEIVFRFPIRCRSVISDMR